MNRAIRNGTKPRIGRLVPLVLPLLLAAPMTAAEDTADTNRKQRPWNTHLELGAGYGHYEDSGENANSEFVLLSWSQPFQRRVRLSAGRQHRFGETSYGLGVGYSHHVTRRTRVSFGMSSGSGELIPRFSASAGVSRPFRKVNLSLGYYRWEWDDDARSDGLTLGGQRWFSHWIVSGGLRYNVSEPGSEDSLSGNVGLTYYVWRKTYVNFGVEVGNTRYRAVRMDDALVDYGSTRYNVGVSRWITDDSGVSVRLARGDPPEVLGGTVRWFREW